MAFQLVARSGPTAGNVYPLEQEEIFIGRDLNNDIVVNDPEVSRRHTRLYEESGSYVLEDLGSTNGTSVNGQRLVGPHRLRSGELIVLGENITFVFEGEQPPDSEATIVSGMGSDATVRASSTPPKPQQQFTPPVPEPIIAQKKDPYAMEPAPQEQDFMAQEPPSYARNMPGQPVPEMPGAEKKKFPVWIIIVIVLLMIICVCVVAGIIVDSQNMYCNQLNFIFGDILGMCN